MRPGIQSYSFFTRFFLFVFHFDFIEPFAPLQNLGNCLTIERLSDDSLRSCSALQNDTNLVSLFGLATRAFLVAWDHVLRLRLDLRRSIWTAPLQPGRRILSERCCVWDGLNFGMIVTICSLSDNSCVLLHLNWFQLKISFSQPYWGKKIIELGLFPITLECVIVFVFWLAFEL